MVMHYEGHEIEQRILQCKNVVT